MASVSLQHVFSSRAAYAAYAAQTTVRPYEAITFLRHCRTRSLHSKTNVSANTNTVPVSASGRNARVEAQRARSRHLLPPQPRSLSTTGPRCATVVTQNPRQDEDGNEMTITISDRAAKRLRQITSTAPRRNTLTTSSSNSTTASDAHLRVSVTSGGCHGFQYLMSLEAADKIDPDEDTVFVTSSSETTARDRSETMGKDSGSSGGGGGEVGSAKVVLDESSLELLKGSTVDFTTELIGSQFKIVGNPRATSSCGCGTSFDIE